MGAARSAAAELAGGQVFGHSLHIHDIKFKIVGRSVTQGGANTNQIFNTVNGTVEATYRQNPAADTKFRTVNGKLDLYFQPSLSADFHVKTLNGKAYTDFDMTSIPSGSPEETKGMKVIHRRGTSGALRAGNGGPKISTETVNGSILIHSLAKGRP